MKRSVISIAFAICLLFSLVVRSDAFNDENIVKAKTPTDNSELLFSKRFGANFKNSPTPPVYYKNCLIVAAGNKIYKLDAFSGEEILSNTMISSSFYGTTSPICVNDTVYMAMDGGYIEAFDFATLKPKWVFKDELGGQAISQITYSDGCIYTGFWRNETNDGNFICIDVFDEDINTENESKKQLWQYKSKGGFYWAGAEIYGDYLIVGSEDGERDTKGESKILSLNKKTGELISELNTNGDIRSGIVFSEENSAFYTASKAGYIYKFKIDNKTGKLYDLKGVKSYGQITATPVVYKNRLYVGCQNGMAGKLIILDSSTLKELYSVDVKGYPQATPLLSKGYEEETGKIYLYFTYNQKPGGIMVLEDDLGKTQPKLKEIYSPMGNLSEHSISPIATSDDGILYYKNDSGNIFAVWKGADNFLVALNSFILFVLNTIKSLIKSVFI